MFLNDWKSSGLDGMISDFGISHQDLDGCRILLADYTYEDYSGSAYVLFEKDGTLYEVVGSHCSCFGLSESDYSGDTESQWQPEETTIEAVRHRLESAWEFEGCREELRHILDSL